MIVLIAYLFGVMTGIAAWCYYDMETNSYDRGYADGYRRGICEGKEE